METNWQRTGLDGGVPKGQAGPRIGTAPPGAYCSCGAWLGELGAEPIPHLYVAHLVEVFREVRRVLRDDGTVWLNLGDSYAGSGGGGGNTGLVGNGVERGGYSQRIPAGTGLKSKNLVGIPWRVAFALQDDGWYLRSDIIFSKPNPMPEPVRDRPTRSHEYIFLLTKKDSYYYDADAYRMTNERAEEVYPSGGKDKNEIAVDRTTTGRNDSGDLIRQNPNGANLKTVWQVPTQPYKGAHFAVWPEEIPKRVMLLGTSEKGACGDCGAPWERVSESTSDLDLSRPQSVRAMEIAKSAGPTEEHISAIRSAGIGDVGKALVTTKGAGHNTERVPRLAQEAKGALGGYYREFLTVRYTTTGWQPSCECHGKFREQVDIDEDGEENATRYYKPTIPLDQHPILPCVVMDIFSGSGTTVAVARKLGRRSIGIELNPNYVKLAEDRPEIQTPSMQDEW